MTIGRVLQEEIQEAVEALRGRLADELVDPAEAVEKAELRVDVEVREVVRGDRHGKAHGTRPLGARTAPREAHIARARLEWHGCPT